jgi:hypothetical protein
MYVCVVTTLTMVILLGDFWALCDNIYDCVFTTLDFPAILDGQFIC